MQRSDSQKALILGYLEAGNAITPLEALTKFGCLRLGGRIHELRKEGHNINGELVTVKGGKHVQRYWMGK